MCFVTVELLQLIKSTSAWPCDSDSEFQQASKWKTCPTEIVKPAHKSRALVEPLGRAHRRCAPVQQSPTRRGGGRQRGVAAGRAYQGQMDREAVVAVAIKGHSASGESGSGGGRQVAIGCHTPPRGGRPRQRQPSQRYITSARGEKIVFRYNGGLLPA